MGKEIPNKFTDMVNEVFDAGGKGGGSGVFSYTSRTGAQTWVPGKKMNRSPEFRHTTAEPSNFLMQKDEEEASHQAPKIVPFTLDFINDHLASAFISVQQAEQQLKHCKNNDTMVKENEAFKTTVNVAHKELQKIKTQLKKIGQQLDKLTLSP
jgi:hypothetical protein